MIKHLLYKKKLERVFTPGTVATLTYVSRKAVEKDFTKFLGIPGIQIILYGYSGCGKSTLNENILKNEKINFVTSRCQSNTTMNELILDGFDQLDVFYENKRTIKESVNISNELSAKYLEIGAVIKSNETTETSNTHSRILPIQLTPQRLAEFMGAAECIWVIEDFHKIEENEKKLIADILKIFVDTANKYPKTKVVLIGAVATAREMIELESNLSNRVAEIPVPLMSELDLKKIVIKGSKLMNLSISKDITDKIVYYSNNLGQICHQICYDLCFNRDLTKTSLRKVTMTESDFKNAVASHIRKQSDTYNKIYDKIDSNRLGVKVLTAILNIDKEFFSINDFYNEIKKVGGINKNNASEILNSFTTSEFEEIIRLDKHSKKYSFSNPFFQSYFKMKIALLEHEQSMRKTKKSRKSFSLKTDDRFEIFINDKFLSEYYAMLEESLNKKLKYFELQNKLIENNIRKKKK